MSDELIHHSAFIIHHLGSFTHVYAHDGAR